MFCIKTTQHWKSNFDCKFFLITRGGRGSHGERIDILICFGFTRFIANGLERLGMQLECRTEINNSNRNLCSVKILRKHHSMNN